MSERGSLFASLRRRSCVRCGPVEPYPQGGYPYCPSDYLGRHTWKETTLRYRKKPVEIEAVQFTGDPESCTEVSDFLGGPYATGHRWNSNTHTGGVIVTLEGEMAFGVGDWIIRGVKGEHYPCKPDIFDATYEAVEA